jgi:hypothetical protein
MLAYPLQHTGTLANLGADVLVKDGLHQDENGAMLGLDAKLLRLEVDVDVVNIVNAALLLGLLLDPGTQLVVDGVATALALLVLILAVQNELLLELARELLLASLDGFGAHVHSPLVVLDLDLGGLETLRLGLNLARQGVVAALDALVVGGGGGVI